MTREWTQMSVAFVAIGCVVWAAREASGDQRGRLPGPREIPGVAGIEGPRHGIARAGEGCGLHRRKFKASGSSRSTARATSRHSRSRLTPHWAQDTTVQ